MNNYKIKSSKHKVEDINEKGIVTIKITEFDYFDSDNDRLMKGALNKTWRDGKQYHVVNHDLSLNGLVGYPISKDPSEGVVHSKLNLNTDIGKNLFENYKFMQKMGSTLEHSHGFMTIEDKTKKNEKGGWDFHEIVQKEYSTVLYGAVDKTPLLGIKSDKDILSEIDLLEIKLQKGDYTDTYFLKIEKRLNELQNFLKQPSIDTVKEVIQPEPLINTQQEQLKQFSNHLNF